MTYNDRLLTPLIKTTEMKINRFGVRLINLQEILLERGSFGDSGGCLTTKKGVFNLPLFVNV